jgi:hypothetical protein
MTNTTQTKLLGEIAVDDHSLAVLANERRRTGLRCLRAVDLPIAVDPVLDWFAERTE